VPRSTSALIRLMIKPFRWRAAVFFGLTFFGVLAWTSAPFIIAQIVNTLSQAHTVTSGVWLLVAIYVIALILDEGLWRTAEFWMRSFKPVMVERVRTILFTAVLKKSYSYFVGSSSGRIGHWINETTTTSNELIDTTIWTVWSRITSMSISAGFLFYSHWLLGTLFVVWLVLLFSFNIYRGRRFSQLVAKQSNETSKASGIVVDSISNHLSVRVFNARKREYDALTAQQDKIIYSWRRSWFQNWITNLVKGQSTIVASTTALLLIMWLYSQGQVRVGDIVLFIAYFGDAGSSLWQLAWAFDNYFRNFGTIQNALDGLRGEDERTVAEHVKPPKADRVALELDHLSFAYTERPDMPVIDSLNFTIAAGEKIGVVGHSGAGKSTLVGLLLGFYEPTSGEVRINGESATKHDPAYIRSMTSFVPQDTHLFNRSVRANISYARPKAIEEEIINALHLAQAYKFVSSLPQGIDTVIGERGVKLSGGQRQRLAIARAILQDAPLLIMDEATSALDSVSEQAIQKALHELMKQRTSIVIAHRLSTLKHLDRIIVLDKGRIREAGSHDELIKQGGIYADLWERQKDGFIAD
jgi:ABC-type multidrug transport system fused ATPase/permease subunit